MAYWQSQPQYQPYHHDGREEQPEQQGQQSQRQQRTAPPQFYFTVEFIVVLDPQTNRHGFWVPPSTPRANRKASYRLVFGFNGIQTNVIQELPAGLQKYKTYSVYYNDGTFFTAKRDAAVQNDREYDEDDGSSSGDESENEQQEADSVAWRRLTFSALPNDMTGTSYASQRLLSDRLLTQRWDQNWATQLFPDQYQARPEDRTDESHEGGLVGDLPLLIGLLIMSLPTQVSCIQEKLPWMIASHTDGRPKWRARSPNEVPRTTGWQDGRGVVVKVYRDGNTITEEDLQRYELGYWGKLFS